MGLNLSLRVLSLLLGILYFSGCRLENYKLSKGEFCADPSVFSDLGIEIPSEVAVQDQPLIAMQNKVWPVGQRQISVCWEANTWNEEDDADRELVRQTIKQSWEATLSTLDNDFPIPVFKKQVHFIGWKKCTDAGADIRIRVADERPRSFIGTGVKGVASGMILNFTFVDWNSTCSRSEAMRKLCLKRITLHEFGHALGLVHEQNRSDTPPDCLDELEAEGEKRETRGDFYGGKWDKNSVMNYCNNTDILYDGKLPEQDKYWVRALYTPEYYNENYECVSLKDYKKITPVALKEKRTP